MQALLLGSIIGGGYFLSKTGKNSRKSSISWCLLHCSPIKIKVT